MNRRLRLAISPCPNDTFVFHGILERRVDFRGLDLDVELADVQQLNERLARGTVDVVKASFAAALRHADRYSVLQAGAALGFGNGPLVLAAQEGDHPSRPRDGGARARVLAPGADTTAALLYRLFHGNEGNVEHASFETILPALARGEADFGVCIHEARFTYERYGLHLVEDLGARWEAETHSPLPLGGIFARRDLGPDVHEALTATIRDSLALARLHRDAALVTMRRHAQEFDDDVLLQHVALYVNEFTDELGEVGARAVAELTRRAAAVRSPAGAPRSQSQDS